MHIPTERMASPTHMSAAGVSLEVKTDMVRLSSEEFRGIGLSFFLMLLQIKNPSSVSYSEVCAGSLSFIQADVSPW